MRILILSVSLGAAKKRWRNGTRLEEAEEAPVRGEKRQGKEEDKKSREQQPIGVSNVREAAAAATCRQEMLPRTTVVTGQSEASSRLQHHILPKQREDNVDNDMRTRKGKTSVGTRSNFLRGHADSLLRFGSRRSAGLAPKGGAQWTPGWLAGVATLRGADGTWSIDSTRRMVFPVSTVGSLQFADQTRRWCCRGAPRPSRRPWDATSTSTSTVLARWRRREPTREGHRFFSGLRDYRLPSALRNAKQKWDRISNFA